MDHQKQDTSCIICLESLLGEDQDVATIANCQHVFHELCIKEWSERTNSEYTTAVERNEVLIGF